MIAARVSQCLRAGGLALAILAVGAVNQAKADLQLTILDETTSMSQVFTFVGTTGTESLLVGGYTISDVLTSNLPGATSGTLSQALTFSNPGTTGLDNLKFTLVTTTSYTSPAGPYTFSSDPSTTTNLTLAGGTLNGTSTLTPTGSGPTTITNPSIAFGAGGSAGEIVSASGVQPYTLQNTLELLNLSGINGGISDATATITTSVITPSSTPEPATIAMLATAIPFGLVYLKRRKAAKVASNV
jgi:hypothetical protein